VHLGPVCSAPNITRKTTSPQIIILGKIIQAYQVSPVLGDTGLCAGWLKGFPEELGENITYSLYFLGAGTQVDQREGNKPGRPTSDKSATGLMTVHGTLLWWLRYFNESEDDVDPPSSCA
jgi:hypothetical protein